MTCLVSVRVRNVERPVEKSKVSLNVGYMWFFKRSVQYRRKRDMIRAVDLHRLSKVVCLDPTGSRHKQGCQGILFMYAHYTGGLVAEEFVRLAYSCF